MPTTTAPRRVARPQRPTRALTVDETARLRELEADIARDNVSGIALGRVLKEIKDRRLYRVAFPSLEVYLDRRWEITRQHAHQLMRAATVADALESAGLPTPKNTTHVLELYGLPATDWAAAWTRAHEIARRNDTFVRRAHVAQAVAERAARGEPWEEWACESQAPLSELGLEQRREVAHRLNEIGEPVTPGLVKHAVDAYSANLTESGTDTLPAALYDRDEFAGAGVAANAPIEDLDILRDGPVEGGRAADEAMAPSEPARAVGAPHDLVEVEGGATPRTRGGRVMYLEPDTRRPFLISIPSSLCPDDLRERVDDAREVLVDVRDLEQAGGPVVNGVIDVARVRGAAREGGLPARFNRTNESVDWAQWTWNPLTGCYHDCAFGCYAEEIANRFYVQGFTPTFYPHRLNAPANTPLPAPGDPKARTVFVCSMADLFGGWVPAYIIQAVLDVVHEHPEWTFIFLTKAAGRLTEFSFPENAWVGVTVTDQRMVVPAEEALMQCDARVKWISIEPFLGRITFTRLREAGINMLALGGLSLTLRGRRHDPPLRTQPDPAWVRSIIAQADAAGVGIYEKDNLDRLKELPFDRAEVMQDAPEAVEALQPTEGAERAPGGAPAPVGPTVAPRRVARPRGPRATPVA